MQYADGRTDNGTVAASDTVTDLAVVRVDRKNLPAATFNTDTPQVGSLDRRARQPARPHRLGHVGDRLRAQPQHPRRPGPAGARRSHPDRRADLAGQLRGCRRQCRRPGHRRQRWPTYRQNRAPSRSASPPRRRRSSTSSTSCCASGKAEHAFLGIQPATLTPEIASPLGLSVQQGVLVYAVYPRARRRRRPASGPGTS